MGKERDEYETASPDTGIEEPDPLVPTRNTTIGKNGYENHRKSHSNELMLEEEKYYDDDGNELNGRNY